MNWIQKMGAAVLGLSVKLRGGGNSAPAIHASGSQDGRPVASEWSAEKAINEGLKVNAWVYSAVTKIATGLASVPLLLERAKGDTWAPETDHELAALLRRPNPFMARQDMLERWAIHMLLAGNGFWWLNIVGGKPTEIWPIMPDQISPIASRADFISGYEWRLSSTDKRVLPTDQVAHWMFVDPGNPRWGLAPLQAAAAAVDLDQAAAKWNRAVLRNDGKPPLAIFLDGALTHAEMKTATAQVREQMDGASVRQALVLGGASKAQPLAMNATELDFLNGRRFSREEIAAVFGVPPILMSFGEAATFSNLDAAKAILWEDRIVPLLDDLCQGLEGALFRFWGLTSGEWRIRADLSGVRALQANLKTEAEVDKLKSETFKTYVDAGVPGNMAAKLLGLPLEKIPGGDQPRAVAGPPMPTQTKGRAPPFERKDKGGAEEADPKRLERLDAWVEKLRPKIAELLLEQGSAVASAYAAGQPWDTALSLDDWQALMEAIHTAVIESEGAVAYTGLLSAITSAGGGGAFDVLADNVTEWIAEHVGENLRYIDDATRLALQAEITAGVEAGEGTRDIAKRLRDLHTDWSGWRAERIARTETGSAFSAAHQLTAEQMAAETDVQLVKTWHSTGDSRTRDEHAAMDGETVDIDEAFSNGLMQPGDPNCRCVVTYGAKGG